MQPRLFILVRFLQFSVIIALLFQINIKAQLSQYQYTTYTTENELADNGVMHLQADRTGTVWIATRNGLSRYDGDIFRNYYHLPGVAGSLRSNWITNLALDSTGILWVSTEWGLCYYNSLSDNFTYLTKSDGFGILYKAPLVIDRDNFLWIATGNGLKKIDTYHKTWQSTAITNLPDPQSIAIDQQQNIWIGTRGSGLFQYNPRSNTYKRIYLPGLPKDIHIMDLHADGKKLWAATSEGLIAIGSDGKATLHNSFAGNPGQLWDKLMCVAAFKPLTGDSLLLCGTYNKKLLLFNKRLGLFTEELVNTNSKLFNIPAAIFNCLYAKGQVLWMGTDAGLCKLNLQQQNIITYLLPLQAAGGKEKPLVKSLVADSSNPRFCWLTGGATGQLIRYDLLQNEAIGASPHISGDNAAVALLQAQKNDLWVVRKHSIAHYNSKGILQKNQPCNSAIFSATYDGNHHIWLGTESGLASLEMNNGGLQFFNYQFNGTQVENQSATQTFPVTGLAYDGGQHIWLASIKYGLFSFNIKTHQFTAYRQPFNAIYETKNRCSSVSFGKNGLLWVGNMSGLSHFDTATKRFVNYNRDRGLLSTYVYSIATTPNGFVWGRGNAGVFCYSPVNQRFSNYQLPVAFSTDMIFQNLSVVNGNIYLGFQGGFARFNGPQSKPQQILPVQITGVNVLGKRLPFDNKSTQPINFSYDQNVIAIQYTAVDFTDQPINFEYRMDGIYNTWMDAGKQRTVLFPAMHPGHYTFEVRCRQEDDKTFAPVTAFTFTIQPPFWQTNSFRLLVFLLLVFLLAAFVYLQFKKMQKREIENLRRVREHADLEMKALRSQMNPHFIFNALNSIHRYILGNRQEDASEYLIKFSKLMRQVLENSQHKLISIQEELRALALYMELEHRRIADRFSYTITTEEDVNLKDWLIPPLLLQPYVENAIWHGLAEKEERGCLSIKIYTQNNLLYCEIDDNGIGREATGGRQKMFFKKMSLGTNISSARIGWLRQHNNETATVQIIDKKDNEKALGTTVLLTLPIILKETEKIED